jgi:GNAT superfamily N-acetyltransferase
MYRIDEAVPGVDDYQRLRASVGWGSPGREACATALAATAFAVVARRGEEVVGMARLVGDTTMYLLVVDVVVHPGHQGAGLGRRMVRTLVGRSTAEGVRSLLLVAGEEVVPFYEALDFRGEFAHLMRHTPPARQAPVDSLGN